MAEIDYNEHYVMVHYQDKNYYEQPFNFIKIRQNEIIKDCKIFYENSLTEILLEVSKKNNEEIEKFINFNIEAIKVKLNILKDDFYVDNKKSRYCSILYDNFDDHELDLHIAKRDQSNDSEINSEFNAILNRLNSSYDFDNRYYIGGQYFLELLYYRSIQLSILPFKLFQIGHKFIIALIKIKELNSSENHKKEQLQSGNETKKQDTYFGKFCEIIDDYTILKKSTAIGVMVDLVDCIKKIKSETLLELQNKGNNRNDYLDYLINEIEKQNYSKDIDISYIQKWLDEYEISIEKILEMKYRYNSIEAVIDRHYNDMEKFSPEKDQALLVQTDFYYYFCKHYSDELINYFNSKKENQQTNIPSKAQLPMKHFKDEYLNVFCKEISDERIIKETCFDLVYDGIIHFVPYLETEIIENLFHLGNDKRDDYLNYAINKIQKMPFVDKEKINIDKWLKKYNVVIDEFPKFSNDELNHWLKRYYNGYSETPHDLDFILDIQIDFYCYTSMVEANKMIDFLESKRTTVNKASNKMENSNETETAKQLTVNQAVILLDKLGVFNTNMFENVSNVKRALIISQLIGKNDKNIKTAIEKLELKPSAITPNYQMDIDKIERILNNLE